ncbi:hypothetical protein D3C79_700890 [compost metagenome]
MGVVHQHVQAVELWCDSYQLPAARRPASFLLFVVDQRPGRQDFRFLPRQVQGVHGAGGGGEVEGVADVHAALHQLLRIRVEELGLGTRGFLAAVVEGQQLDAAVAAQRGDAALAHRIAEHAAGNGDFAGHGPGLGVDHGDRSRRSKVVDIDEAVVGAGGKAETLGQRLGAFGRNDHFPLRCQLGGIPGGQHVGAGAAGAARIEQVGAVQQLAVTAQGRGGGEAGADHAEETLLVRVDHDHAAGDKIVELDIDHIGAVRRWRERQHGLADAAVSGQLGEGGVRAGERHAKSQGGLSKDPGYSHQGGSLNYWI